MIVTTTPIHSMFQSISQFPPLKKSKLKRHITHSVQQAIFLMSNLMATHHKTLKLLRPSFVKCTIPALATAQLITQSIATQSVVFLELFQANVAHLVVALKEIFLLNASAASPAISLGHSIAGTTQSVLKNMTVLNTMSLAPILNPKKPLVNTPNIPLSPL